MIVTSAAPRLLKTSRLCACPQLQVFVILSLCGHLYRAVHGRRGSWMQLQLPFLTLTNSYVALLTHAFWPSDGVVAPVNADVSGGSERSSSYADAELGRGQGLLDEDEED